MELQINKNLTNITLRVSYADTVVESLSRIIKNMCYLKWLYEDEEDKKIIAGLEIELKFQAKGLSYLKDIIYTRIILAKSEKKEFTETEKEEFKKKINDLIFEITEILYKDILAKIIQKENKDEAIKRSKEKILAEIYILMTKINLAKYMNEKIKEEG